MHTSSEPVVSPEWQQPQQKKASEENSWLRQARRFSLVQTHIGLFAGGSVVLLTVNLLVASPNIWADTWIARWGLLLIMHAVVAGIASLVLQLIEDDDIRPASEVRWDPLTTWKAPTSDTPNTPDAPPETSAPVLSQWRASTMPYKPAGPQPAAPKNHEKVSWQAATDAAWLARPSGASQDEARSKSASSSGDAPTDAPHADR